MTLSFTLDPDLTPELRDGIVRLWADVTNAAWAPSASSRRSPRRTS